MTTLNNRPAKSWFKSVIAAVLAVAMAASMAVVPFAADPAETEEVLANNGMVSASDPAAAAIGVEVLKNGGNAMDAAIATAFALGVGESAASGIGGNGLMLYYDASTGKTTSIEYLGATPAGMTVDMHRPENKDPRALVGKTGDLAAVPGFVAGMLKAHDLFATKELSELVQPAIDMAENGVEVTPFMGEQFGLIFDKLILCPESDRVYTNDGFPYMEGEIFTNPDYAKTLKLIVEKGFDGFYRGEVAQSIVESLKEAGGVMTLDDLSHYAVDVREPFENTYRGYKVVVSPPPSNGAVVLAALNLAELFDISKYEHNSPEYLHLWAEIFKVAFGDRILSIYDPDYRDVTGAYGMITKAYARHRKSLIKMDSSLGIGPNGYPFLFAPVEMESHTTHLSVMDKDGNVVSMTNTNGNFFGTRITAKGYGFTISNLTLDYTLVHEYPEAGMKPRQNMCPVIMFYADGTPYAALGTPGSQRIITTDIELISNLVDYGMDIQTALDMPRFYQGRNGGMDLEFGIDPSVIPELQKVGHSVKFYNEQLDEYFGGAHAVLRDKNGVFHGGADPRRSGMAIGY